MGEVLRPVDPERMMPVEEVLPGVSMPLLILPNVGVGRRRTFDHRWFQGNDPRLQGAWRRPLRHSSGQYLPWPTHNRKNVMYDAVEMPETDDTVYQAVLLGLAHYISSHVIDLSGQKPVIVETTESMRRECRRDNWLGVQPGTEWRLGLYLAMFTLERGLDAVRQTTEVARFLDARDEQARQFASYGVVRQALRVVLDPFEPAYERARRRGAIRRPEATASRFVARYFDRHQPDYVPTIADALLGVAASS